MAEEIGRKLISVAEHGGRSSKDSSRTISLAVERNRFFKEHKKLKYKKVS
ncbi:hypothetical protein LEP1GSC188_1045 [Leptospira weilii serovar Topaz str. LT2116]|uniref:Uncharacterized protein n=1 Tax=Leptospira weilii serovar Topaz str. LT2116 TaxID=1088540 RepID=M3FIU4_9LEPT|nr:hypothetical protein LEP1GSC188_1045 [Leptospira weilii serovar Topaz str. LT2116]